LAGIALTDDVVAELREVQKHGIRLHFVFSDDDPGLRILRELGGRAVRRMQRDGLITICTLDGTDHTFSTLAARNALLSEVELRLSTSRSATRDDLQDQFPLGDAEQRAGIPRPTSVGSP
jgi:hypothetical protein